MKKIVSILLLFSCLLSSCATGTTDDDIAANLENYESLYGGTSPSDTETQYFSTVDTGVEGIFSSDWAINDNKYYFVTKRKDNKGLNAVEMITYVDLETGDSHIICQDPLCEHQEDGNCKYTEFQDIFFSAPGVFYSTRIKDPDGIAKKRSEVQICRIDLNQDTVTPVYATEIFSTFILGLADGRLYFYENINITSNKATVKKIHLYCLNTADGTVEDLGFVDDKVVTDLTFNMKTAGSHVYYVSRTGKLIETDMTFQTQTEVFDCGEDILNNLFYDTETGELWFSVINQEANTGSVYVYADGETKQVKLPHENIFSFTLTDSKIYYSSYNPVYYGISATAYYFNDDPEDCKVYDYSGGKVYAADRNDLSESTLIYDNNGEYVICDLLVNYSIFGNYLYFEEDEIIREVINGVEYTYFSSADTVNKIRVNLTTGEMRRIVFE